MSYAEATFVAIVAAVTTALLSWLGHFVNAYAQRQNEQAKFFREKLLERYSELIASVTADIDRARSQAAAMALGKKDEEYTKEAMKLDEKRHVVRVDLLRLSLQIKLLDDEPQLADRLTGLAKRQPFMAY